MGILKRSPKRTRFPQSDVRKGICMRSHFTMEQVAFLSFTHVFCLTQITNLYLGPRRIKNCLQASSGHLRDSELSFFFLKKSIQIEKRVNFRLWTLSLKKNSLLNQTPPSLFGCLPLSSHTHTHKRSDYLHVTSRSLTMLTTWPSPVRDIGQKKSRKKKHVRHVLASLYYIPILEYVCRHTNIYTAKWKKKSIWDMLLRVYYTRMCPHTYILVYVSSYSCSCGCTTLSYYDTRILGHTGTYYHIHAHLRHMCPHTTICYYLCPHIQALSRLYSLSWGSLKALSRLY